MKSFYGTEAALNIKHDHAGLQLNEFIRPGALTGKDSAENIRPKIQKKKLDNAFIVGLFNAR